MISFTLRYFYFMCVVIIIHWICLLLKYILWFFFLLMCCNVQTFFLRSNKSGRIHFENICKAYKYILLTELAFMRCFSFAVSLILVYSSICSLKRYNSRSNVADSIRFFLFFIESMLTSFLEGNHVWLDGGLLFLLFITSRPVKFCHTFPV